MGKNIAKFGKTKKNPESMFQQVFKKIITISLTITKEKRVNLNKITRQLF